MKLGQIVGKLHESGLFTPQDISTAMMAVGVEVARMAQGGSMAAEWLRGIADEIEKSGLPQQKH